MKKIIAFIGVRGSGKDYCANATMESSKLSGYKKLKVGFSDSVRNTTFQELNVYPKTPEEYDEFKKTVYYHDKFLYGKTGRDWLEYFGEGLREKFPLTWCNRLIDKVRFTPCEVLIVTDCRFPHEAMALLSLSRENKADIQFIFCDYRSGRYDDTENEPNRMALGIREQGTKHLDDITKLFLS